MQRCSTAPETSPIWLGPACLARNSSEMWSPRFMPPPTPPTHTHTHPIHTPIRLSLSLTPFVTSLSYCWEGGEPGAREEEGRGGGVDRPRALMERVSMKWPSGSDASWACFTLAWAYGWGWVQGGEIQQRGRERGRRLAGMLLYVLFSPSTMCVWSRELTRQWELHLLCCVLEDHRG